ncbi:MAG: FG-GAP repeat domain-containing protein, partial [Hyphomonadaceae bacterium]
MRSLLLAGASCAALVFLSACGANETVAQCAAPRLVPSELRVGDGALDRGWIGGVSLVDVDGDGDLDLMATRGYDTSAENVPFRYDRSMLYINDGRGRFTHAADNPLSNAGNPDSGSTWGDVDGDGDLDAFVSIQHNRPDRFYRNLGQGRFAREELGDATTAPGSNFSSTWGDIDGDGDLDLVSGGPTLEPSQPNLVFRNDNGRFVRVADSPLANGVSNAGAVLFADIDNDGDQDFFAAHSDITRVNNMTPATFESAQIFRNDGQGRFTRMEGQAFDDRAFPAIGGTFGDIDNDGDLDLFIQAQPGGDLPGGSHRMMSDRLYRNDGQGHYTHDAAFTGPAHRDIGGGAAFADFDGDGDLDLIAASYGTGIALYMNDGTGVFTLVEDAALSGRVNTQLSGRVNTHAAVATGDLDGDGDIDAAIGNWGDSHAGEFVTLLTNESASCGQPLRVRLENRAGASDPIGAHVTMVTQGR